MFLNDDSRRKILQQAYSWYGSFLGDRVTGLASDLDSVISLNIDAIDTAVSLAGELENKMRVLGQDENAQTVAELKLRLSNNLHSLAPIKAEIATRTCWFRHTWTKWSRQSIVLTNTFLSTTAAPDDSRYTRVDFVTYRECLTCLRIQSKRLPGFPLE